MVHPVCQLQTLSVFLCLTKYFIFIFGGYLLRTEKFQLTGFFFVPFITLMTLSHFLMACFYDRKFVVILCSLFLWMPLTVFSSSLTFQQIIMVYHGVILCLSCLNIWIVFLWICVFRGSIEFEKVLAIKSINIFYHSLNSNLFIKLIIFSHSSLSSCSVFFFYFFPLTASFWWFCCEIFNLIDIFSAVSNLLLNSFSTFLL